MTDDCDRIRQEEKHFYPRDVVSGVLATAMCLAGWLDGWVSVRHTLVLYQNG